LAKEDESADKTLVDKADTPLEKDKSKGDKKDNGEDEGANTIAENTEADSAREASTASPEKAEADSTREASTSPEKQGAGKVHKPRKFLPLSKRSPPAKANVEDEAEDKDMDEEINLNVDNDDDSTSTYRSGSTTEFEECDKDKKPAAKTTKKEAKKKKQPAAKTTEEDAPVSTPTEVDTKPPAKQDNKPPAKQNFKQPPAKPDRKQFDSNSDFLTTLFPDQVAHRKPEESENPNKGTRATEKKRLVGQHPATERQQMDDKVCKQFALSLKHDCKLMPMMTPISRTDGFLDAAAGRTDLEIIAQETDCKSVTPIKGLHTEMKPNSGGSVAVQKHLKPKLGLLVPSKAVGLTLFNILAKAVSGEVQLEFFYEAFGEEGLMSMLVNNKTGDKKKQPEVKQPEVKQPEVKPEPVKTESPPTNNPAVTKGADGEEHATI